MTPRLLAPERARLRALEQERRGILRHAREAERQARTGRKGPPAGRQARVRDPGYLAFVRRCPCLGCGTTRRVEAAHVRSAYPEAGWPPTAMQRKPDDARALPLCALCHRDGPDAQHRGSERAWHAARGLHPPTVCAALMTAYRAGIDGAAVVASFREGLAA